MIKVTDVAYARFTAPDLDRMEGFLNDFGLVRPLGRRPRCICATAQDHHVHVTKLEILILRGLHLRPPKRIFMFSLKRKAHRTCMT